MSVIDVPQERVAESPEGSASLGQQAFLRSLVRRIGAEWVAEIGMNSGASTRAFLSAKPDLVVTSFDIGEHDYLIDAKMEINADFPGRHELIIGDSTETVPEYAGQALFDMVFIDGGHENEVPHQDIKNMARLIKPNGIVVIDDITPWQPWGKAPTRALVSMIRSGILTQPRLHTDKPGKDVPYPSNLRRVWATARYTKRAKAQAA